MIFSMRCSINKFAGKMIVKDDDDAMRMYIYAAIFTAHMMRGSMARAADCQAYRHALMTRTRDMEAAMMYDAEAEYIY